MKNGLRTHCHHALHHAALSLGGGLHAFHGPPLQHRCHLWVFYVEQAEPCHVDSTVAVWLKVQRKQVLRGQNSGFEPFSYQSP